MGKGDGQSIIAAYRVLVSMQNGLFQTRWKSTATDATHADSGGERNLSRCDWTLGEQQSDDYPYGRTLEAGERGW